MQQKHEINAEEKVKSFFTQQLKTHLPIIELIVYYILNVATFGVVWLFKIVLKKAFAEALYRDKK